MIQQSSAEKCCMESQEGRARHELRAETAPHPNPSTATEPLHPQLSLQSCNPGTRHSKVPTTFPQAVELSFKVSKPLPRMAHLVISCFHLFFKFPLQRAEECQALLASNSLLRTHPLCRRGFQLQSHCDKWNERIPVAKYC